jgi:hypothetical protein
MSSIVVRSALARGAEREIVLTAAVRSTFKGDVAVLATRSGNIPQVPSWPRVRT